MQRIDELKNELKEAIVESDEYQEYKELELMIKRNPELKKAVDEFRRQNFELQYDEEIEDMFSASCELNNRFADIKSQSIVNRYLAAELCLSRLVQDICMAVVDAVDFDMDFLQ